MSGDDRTRTGDLSPDKRVLSPLSYVPEWRGWDSNPRSRAHEAREDSRSSTARIWPAGLEPAISGVRGRWDSQLPYSQKSVMRETPGGTRTRTSGLRARCHSLLRPRGHEARAAGFDPALSRVTVALHPTS